MRFNLLFPLSFLIAIFLANCGTTGATIKTLKDDDVDFSSYQTFYLLPEPPRDNKGELTLEKPFPRRIIERAVKRELKIRNYKEVKDKELADMLVAIQFSLKDEERTYTTTNNGYGNNGYNAYGHNSYRYGYRNYYGYQSFSNTTTTTEQYRKGNMIIDLIDRKENSLIWEAFAQGSGETDFDAIEEKVNRVVADIFSRYPLVLDEKK